MPPMPARVYECYVRRCDPKAFTLDAQSRQGRNFTRVSYLLPYIRLTGTGFNVVPEVGSECLILEGGNNLQLVLGFRMPFSTTQEGREELPAGSMEMRVVGEDGSEGRVAVIKGGTVLIQGKKSCRTLYSPSDSSILHVFSSWEMEGPAGFVRWKRPVGGSEASYEAEYNTNIDPAGAGFKTNVIMRGNKPLGFTVTGPSGNEVFKLEVNSSGETELTLNSLKLKALGELKINGSDFTINTRAVLPQGDPI